MDPFWPNTLNEWLGAIAFFLTTVATSMAAAVKWLRAPLMERIENECRTRKAADDGVGGRVTTVEQQCTRHGERLSMVERHNELATAQNNRLERDVGAVTAAVQTLTTQVTELERERLRELGEIREGMAEIRGMIGSLNHRGGS